MKLRRFGTFTGGIDLPDEKDATIDAAIVPLSGLGSVCVPLAPVHAEAARPLVRPGQYVSHGERLGEAVDDDQVDVFSPVAGRVGGFGEVMVPGSGAGWRASDAVEIVQPAEPVEILTLPDSYDWSAADGYSLRMRIRQGGLVTFRQPVVSLAAYVASARRKRVDTLIANVMENTPFVTADHRLLVERGWEVVRGLAILARAMGAADVILAVDHRRTDAYRDTVAPARFYGIQSIALANKYPIGAEAMLIKVLTRRRVRPAASGLDVGVAMTDAATCHATYRWVSCGELPTARVVTVSGPAAGRAGNLLIPFGAGVDEVFSLLGSGTEGPRVYGPAMNGREVVYRAVVTASANALLAMDPPRWGLPSPCIRCGWCGDSCPARLNVAALNDDFELNRPIGARRRGALACVSCGICSYVCPARLPLMQRVGLLKEAIRPDMAGCDVRK